MADNQQNTHYEARAIMKWLWHSWRGNRLQTIINMVIGLLDVAVSLGQVWAVKHAIDVACHHIEGDVILSVALIGALILCYFGLGMLEVWVRNILGVRAQNRMQRQMLDHLLHSEWHGREDMHSGDVINRLEQDVINVVNFLTEVLPGAVSTLALFIGAFIYLFSMDHVLAIIIVCVLPLFIVLSKVYVRRMRHFTRDIRESDSRVQSILQETVQHRMLVKTLEREDTMVGRLDEQHTILQGKVKRRAKFSILSRFIMNLGFALTYLIAFGWSALRLFDGTLTYGGMTAFLQLVNKIQQPARSLTSIIPSFVSVFTAAERLMRLEENELEMTGEPLMIDGTCGIEFDNVSYKYQGENSRFVIRNLSFNFAPGTCTAVLGETGAGKTTIFRLIQDLLHPTAGSIYIYNKVREKVSPLTRCNMVYVPQGNTLLSGSIRDNLLLGSDDATEEQMKEALHTACADFVMDLPDGLDTICSELGAGLSEGQAQRICIARAILRNRSLLLLDEATSALDPETERQLLENLLSSHKFTVIFITHRPAVVDYCDNVLKLERLVENA